MCFVFPAWSPSRYMNKLLNMQGTSPTPTVFVLSFSLDAHNLLVQEFDILPSFDNLYVLTSVMNKQEDTVSQAFDDLSPFK